VVDEREQRRMSLTPANSSYRFHSIGAGSWCGSPDIGRVMTSHFPARGRAAGAASTFS
jgi:hypothetical protein